MAERLYCAYRNDPESYGLYSHGICSHGLYSRGLHSYGRADVLCVPAEWSLFLFLFFLDDVRVAPSPCSENEAPSVSTGHNYIRHNYLSHDFIGCSYTDHDCVGHSHIGHDYIGHNYVGPI